MAALAVTSPFEDCYSSASSHVGAMIHDRLHISEKSLQGAGPAVSPSPVASSPSPMKNCPTTLTTTTTTTTTNTKSPQSISFCGNGSNNTSIMTSQPALVTDSPVESASTPHATTPPLAPSSSSSSPAVVKKDFGVDTSATQQHQTHQDSQMTLIVDTLITLSIENETTKHQVSPPTLSPSVDSTDTTGTTRNPHKPRSVSLHGLNSSNRHSWSSNENTDVSSDRVSPTRGVATGFFPGVVRAQRWQSKRAFGHRRNASDSGPMIPANTMPTRDPTPTPTTTATTTLTSTTTPTLTSTSTSTTLPSTSKPRSRSTPPPTLTSTSTSTSTSSSISTRSDSECTPTVRSNATTRANFSNALPVASELQGRQMRKTNKHRRIRSSGSLEEMGIVVDLKAFIHKPNIVDGTNSATTKSPTKSPTSTSTTLTTSTASTASATSTTNSTVSTPTPDVGVDVGGGVGDDVGDGVVDVIKIAAIENTATTTTTTTKEERQKSAV